MDSPTNSRQYWAKTAHRIARPVLAALANGLLPLGLPASSEFWSAPDAPWTAVKAWHGVDMMPDHSI